MKPFATTASAILHVMEYHHVNHPEKVQIFVKTDVTTVASAVNKKLGQEIYNYRIQQPSNRPICHFCPNLYFPSWDHAVGRTITHHQIFHPWTICHLAKMSMGQFLKSEKGLNISVSYANSQDFFN